MKSVIIKYNAGNIRSVLYALERIGYSAIVTDDLKERDLDKLISSLTQPVLGICLGMQLMCKYSEENDTDCLGIFDERVQKFTPKPPEGGFKIPQIGWNSIYELKTDLFKSVPDNSYCYFVHGYYAAKGEHTIATTDYVQPYSSALHKDNFYGVQFHPEKSAATGETIIKNFLEL
jgi:glutamine amidotransferase